jgi:hypothetical protein
MQYFSDLKLFDAVNMNVRIACFRVKVEPEIHGRPH